jgi:hypothetical protein
MKSLLLFALLSTATMHAQNEGLWEGYNGEWSHVSRQLLALEPRFSARFRKRRRHLLLL